MIMVRFRVGYPQVSGLAGLGMIFTRSFQVRAPKLIGFGFGFGF